MAAAREIAGAVAVDPGAEAGLLAVARHGDHRRLVDRAAKVRQAARSAEDEAAKHARLRARRFARTHTDADGLVILHAGFAPKDWAPYAAAWQRGTDAEFTRARRQGRRDGPQAYAADALLALLARRSSPAASNTDAPNWRGPTWPTTRPTRPRHRRHHATHRRRAAKPEVVVLVDGIALQRGHVRPGERCEIAGVGPVDVDWVRQLLPDAIVDVLVHDGVDITTYASATRAIRKAGPPRRRDPRASAASCAAVTNADRTQTDHRHDYANGGPGSTHNLNVRLHLPPQPEDPRRRPTRTPRRPVALVPTRPHPTMDLPRRRQPHPVGSRLRRSRLTPLRSPLVEEPTYRVSDLTDAIQTALDVCFPDEVWVQGEISSLNRSPAGHVYFQLIEAGEPGGPPVAQLAVTLFSSAKASVNATLKRVGGMRMTDGVEIRLRGRLSFYGAQGRVQLRMSAIDPDYTLGRLASDRERLLRTLAAEGLLGRNATLPLALRPLRVGMVTSSGSAAEADFLHELDVSGLAWEVIAVDTRVQGTASDRGVAAALRQLAGHELDVVAVIRGGGARTDLATFDREVVARAIAGLRLPVVTGIGHEIDRSVADEVAHTACKTPTACAAFLVARARGFHDRVDGRWVEIRRAAASRLDRADRHLQTSAAGVVRSGQAAVLAGDLRIGEASRRLARAAPRSVERATLHLDTTATRVGSLDPARALARGWSITRTATGALVRSAATPRPGDRLVTTFIDGSTHSQVVDEPTLGRSPGSTPAPGRGPTPGGGPDSSLDSFADSSADSPTAPDSARAPEGSVHDR